MVVRFVLFTSVSERVDLLVHDAFGLGEAMVDVVGGEALFCAQGLFDLGDEVGIVFGAGGEGLLAAVLGDRVAGGAESWGKGMGVVVGTGGVGGEGFGVDRDLEVGRGFAHNCYFILGIYALLSLTDNIVQSKWDFLFCFNNLN